MRKKLFFLFCFCLIIFFINDCNNSESSALFNVSQKIDKNITEIEIKDNESNQIECLADNIYQESRGESYKGKVAVAFVTINRTKSNQFPDNVCAVVKQKKESCCQFSWYCDKEKKKESKEKIVAKLSDSVYNESHNIAKTIYYNHSNIKDPTRGALYYHATYIHKSWKGKIKKTKIGKHIFYDIKLKG
jgi:spore germination cell wall hydrolase CwlJ-like protein